MFPFSRGWRGARLIRNAKGLDRPAILCNCFHVHSNDLFELEEGDLNSERRFAGASRHCAGAPASGPAGCQIRAEPRRIGDRRSAAAGRGSDRPTDTNYPRKMRIMRKICAEIFRAGGRQGAGIRAREIHRRIPVFAHGTGGRPAGWQPAKQRTASPRYEAVPIGNRPYRGLAARTPYGKKVRCPSDSRTPSSIFTRPRPADIK